MINQDAISFKSTGSFDGPPIPPGHVLWSIRDLVTIFPSRTGQDLFSSPPLAAVTTFEPTGGQTNIDVSAQKSGYASIVSSKAIRNPSTGKEEVFTITATVEAGRVLCGPYSISRIYADENAKNKFIEKPDAISGNISMPLLLDEFTLAVDDWKNSPKTQGVLVAARNGDCNGLSFLVYNLSDFTLRAKWDLPNIDGTVVAGDWVRGRGYRKLMFVVYNNVSKCSEFCALDETLFTRDLPDGGIIPREKLWLVAADEMVPNAPFTDDILSPQTIGIATRPVRFKGKDAAQQYLAICPTGTDGEDVTLCLYLIELKQDDSGITVRPVYRPRNQQNDQFGEHIHIEHFSLTSGVPFPQNKGTETAFLAVDRTGGGQPDGIGIYSFDLDENGDFRLIDSAVAFYNDWGTWGGASTISVDESVSTIRLTALRDNGDCYELQHALVSLYGDCAIVKDQTSLIHIWGYKIADIDKTIYDTTPPRCRPYFALWADLTGKSAVVGTPVFKQFRNYKQVMGIYQVPPYEMSISSGGTATLPSLMFGQATTDANSFQVSTNTHISLGFSTSEHASAFGASFSDHFNATFGVHFSYSKNTTTSKTIHFTDTIQRADIIHAMVQPFNLWIYPVYFIDKQGSRQISALKVIDPFNPDPLPTYMPSDDPSVLYDADYEVGSILYYIRAQKPGYDDSRLMFEPLGIASTTDTGASLTFDQSNSTDETVGAGVNISISDTMREGVSESFAGMSVGADISETASMNFSADFTTHTNHSDHMTITVHSGGVTDPGYEYEIIPYFYHEKDSGIVMIKYDVSLIGKLWTSYFRVPKMSVVRPTPYTQNPVLRQFTRYIRFTDNPDGTVDITVKLFNNSMSLAQNIICKVYIGGLPIPSSQQKGSLEINRDATLLGTLNIDSVPGTETVAVVLKGQHIKPLEKDGFSLISIEVTNNGSPLSRFVAWGCYPWDQFGSVILLHKDVLEDRQTQRQ